MKKYITSQSSIAPLAVFRALFGFIMLVSIVRFALKGWIYELYIKPDYFFTFYGFDWVVPLGDPGMYLLFGLMGISALGIMLGYRYRLASVLFFLAFTYVELIDKTNYLNHYYFVSIISFLLTLVPANRAFSLDVLRKPSLRCSTVPAWTVNIFKLQLGIVYFYAGAAKLNPDWLLNAMPLKIWLPANTHLPLIGGLLDYEITAYLMSWSGAVYDLFIVFFLLYRPTRAYAYAAVVIFHMMTLFLFQIGMFPYIMILSTLVFFSPQFHEKLIAKAKQFWYKITDPIFNVSFPVDIKTAPAYVVSKQSSGILAVLLIVHFMLQLLLPLRFTLYPGNVFWNEEGYRFSWRVMLMEKAGYTTFEVTNPENGRSWEVPNWKYLTANQEKMMSTQPDMILQFAHHIENEYGKEGIDNLEIRARSYVTLNGRKSQPMIDPAIDLTNIEPGLNHKEWVIPMNDNEPSWYHYASNE